MPNKAIVGTASGAGGITIGSAITILIISLWWPNASAEAAVALTTVCNGVVAAVGTFVGVYLTPHDKPV